MAETEVHSNLVRSLASHIAKRFFQADESYLLIDHPAHRKDHRPPRVNGYVPDVFFSGRLDGDDLTVVGEAKTARDLDNRHTRDQIAAFLHACALSPTSALFVAVPWDLVRTARGLVQEVVALTGTCDVEVEILEKLSGC